MAKKMISRLSVLAVLIVFLAACSKTVEYTNIIPADATVVTSINLKSLASKAGLNDKENEAAKQKVLEALKSGMNAATFQLFFHQSFYSLVLRVIFCFQGNSSFFKV